MTATDPPAPASTPLPDARRGLTAQELREIAEDTYRERTEDAADREDREGD